MNLEDMRHREITRYLQSIKESLNWQDKYIRLTALINDDERAEKVAWVHDEGREHSCSVREQAIDDYRAILLKEVEK